MIVLDTHIWIWWVTQSNQLTTTQAQAIAAEPKTIGISAISCWEIAKAVENGRLQLTLPPLTWLQQALNYPKVSLLDLTPTISSPQHNYPEHFTKILQTK